MQRFVVDTDIFSFIERSGYGAAFVELGRLPVVVTDVVWDECHKGAAHGRHQLLSSVVASKTMITPGTPEAQTASVLSAQGDLEEGEISVISWALHHQEAVPVIHDRQPLLRVIEELQGRKVLSFHGFLGELRTRHHLAWAIADKVSDWFCTSGGTTWKNGVRPQRPIWWGCRLP